jgi:hypothetical protein
MIAIASRLIGNLVVGTCFFSSIVFFLSLAASLRLLPKLLGFLIRVLRWFMILSYRLYSFILEKCAEPADRLFEIDLCTGLVRLMSTTLLSTSIGLSVHLLTDLPWSEWIIAVFSLHGVLVGLLWDKLLDPGGLMLGVNIDEIQ